MKKFLASILATAECVPPTTTELQTEQTNMAPGFPDKKPFDVSFQPTPVDSATAPPCPFRTVGLDVVIPSTPHLSPPHDSLDVIEKVSANAEVHHQSYERQKLRRDGDRAEGDTVIGDLLSAGHVLIPFAVDGYGGLGPIWLDDFCTASAPVGPSLSATTDPTRLGCTRKPRPPRRRMVSSILPPSDGSRTELGLFTVTRTRPPPRTNTGSSSSDFV